LEKPGSNGLPVFLRLKRRLKKRDRHPFGIIGLTLKKETVRGRYGEYGNQIGEISSREIH
jgi:hypothetical protein